MNNIIVIVSILFSLVANADTPPASNILQIRAGTCVGFVKGSAGALACSAVVGVDAGGTGQVTAQAGLDALLPSQATFAGRFLQTDGTHTAWASAGSVSSVALAMPNIFGVSGSPITGSGTLTATLNTQLANTIFAGPSTGAAAAPTFRSLVAADIPTLTAAKISDFTTAAQGSISATSPILYSVGVISCQAASGSLAGCLSSTDWNTFNAKQASLTIGDLTDGGTDGLVVTGGTGSIIGSGVSLAQHVGDSTHNGYLLSTDWTTFNSKQPAGNYITALTGDVTASGPGSVAATVASVGGSSAADVNTATSLVNTAQSGNKFLSSPSGGGSGAPAFRAIVAADLPLSSTSTTGALTSTDWNTFNGKQSALTFSAPLVNTTGTISIPVSTSLADGYLSSTDWSTFNGKQNSLSFGNLSDVGTDGIIVGGGTGAVIGSGTTVAQHVADGTHNGYLSSTDWTTFNGKGAGTVTAVSVASANGFSGNSSGGATPALTLSTTITGILKGDATAISAAASGTDYSAGTAALGTGILKSTTSTGALTIAIAADFPTLNQNTSGNAATVTTNANLTGPVTSVGNATAIANGAISNAMLANGAVANLTNTNSGDVTLAAVGSSPSANGASLSGQVLTLQPFDSTHPGLVPLSGGGTANFLRADGTFAAPVAAGGFLYPTTGSAYGGTNSTLSFSGTNNTIVGNGAAGSLTSGVDNTVYGKSAGGTNLNTNARHVVIGSSAVVGTGQEDVVIGYSASSSSTTTGTNVVIGASASTSGTAGTATAIGRAAVSATGVAIGFGAQMTGSGVIVGKSSTHAQSNSILIGNSLSTSFNSTFIAGQSGVSVTPATAANQVIFGVSGSALKDLWLGQGAAAVAGTPSSISIQGTGVVTTSNQVGGDFTLSAPNGTGTGGSGKLIFRTSPVGSTGAVANTITQVGQVDNTGAWTFGAASTSPAHKVNGTIGFNGSSSGIVTLQTQAAAGTYNFNFPITAGTAGQALLSGGGSSAAQTYGFPSFTTTAQTSTYAVLATDGVVKLSGASFTVTLPAASTVLAGHEFNLCKTDSDLSKIMTIALTGADTFGGLTIAAQPRKMSTYKDCYRVASDGVSDYTVLSHTFDQTENVSTSLWGSTGSITFTTASNTYTQGALYTDGATPPNQYTVNATTTGTTFVAGSIATPASTGTLTLVTVPISFTITAATVSANCVYTNNSKSFTVNYPTASGTTLTTIGTGAPAASGTLTLSVTPSGGTCPATITFSATTGGGTVTSVAWSSRTLSQPTKGATAVDTFTWTRVDATHVRFSLTLSIANQSAAAGTGDYLVGNPAGLYYDTTIKKPWSIAGNVVGNTTGTAQGASIIDAHGEVTAAGSYCEVLGSVGVYDSQSVRFACLQNAGANILNINSGYFAFNGVSAYTLGWTAAMSGMTP